MPIEPTPHYERLIGRHPPGPIYHYTSQEGLISILDSGYLQATDIRYFKDSSEYINAFSFVRKLVENLQRSEGGMSAAFLNAVQEALTFRSDQSDPKLVCNVSCFCEERDKLDLWREFCPQDVGYCFGFDWSGHNDSELLLGKCIYSEDDKRQLVTERLRSFRQVAEGEIVTSIQGHGRDFRPGSSIALKRAVAFVLDVMWYAILFKDFAFRSENEWRVFLISEASSKPGKFRAGQSLLIPFREISLVEGSRLHLSEICVGPTRYPELALEAIRGFVGSLNTVEGRAFRIECDRFVTSSIPKRSFYDAGEST